MSTVRIQIRRGTATEWTNADTALNSSGGLILAAGEMGVETNTRKVKIGDGSTRWSSLQYIAADSPAIGEIAQDAIDQALSMGSGLTKSYNDNTNTISLGIDTDVIATTTYVDDAIGGLQNTVTSDYVLIADVGNAGGPAKLDADGNLLIPKSSIIIEGSAANDYETTITVTNPTADRTITFPDATGTVALTSDISELSQDAINNALSVAQGMNKVYDDLNNTIELGVDPNIFATVTDMNNAVQEVADDLSALTLSTSTDLSTAVNNLTDEINLKAPLAAPTFTGTVVFTDEVQGITAAMVGLDEVDNTSDIDKPVSTATQTALDLKAPLESPSFVTSATFAGTVTLPADTSIGTVTDTEIGYLAGLNSAIQGQLDDKAPIVSPSFSGTTTTGDLAINGTITVNDGSVTVSSTEVGYLDGVTSSIQTQIDSKLSSTTAASTYQPIVSGVSDTEIGYLNGVTSAIQTQIDAKAPSANPTFTVSYTTPYTITNQAALDAPAWFNANGDGTYRPATIDPVTGTLTYPNYSNGVFTGYSTNTWAELQTYYTGTQLFNWISTPTSQTATVSATELRYLDGVTSAIQTQIDSKAPTANPTFTGTVNGITSTMVGLGNVDNTSDVNKPISSATQTALDLKANLAGPTFTGTTTTDDLVVNGDFTVNGTNFAASATTITIEDNMVQLAHQNSANTVDLGLVVAYNDGSAKHAGIVRDVSANEWKLFKGVTTEPSTTVDFTQGSLDDLELNNLTAAGIIFSDGTQTKEGVPSRTPIVQKTGSYTLSSLSERDSLIEVDSTSPVTITIPTNSAVSFPIGTTLDILGINTGLITIAGDTGVTVNATPGLKLRTQWSSATLFKRATDSWVVYGDLKA